MAGPVHVAKFRWSPRAQTGRTPVDIAIPLRYGFLERCERFPSHTTFGRVQVRRHHRMLVILGRRSR